MSDYLIQTKLYKPVPRPGQVLRPYLIKRLDEGLHLQKKLTLVTAKAGAGKTTIVSEWVNQQSLPSAWISLDPRDNQLFRFVNYFHAALAQIGLKINPVQLNQPEIDPSAWVETLLANLLNRSITKESPFILVLDDYHLINNEKIHEALSFLIENKPPKMHLTCITRADPPWPISRLRARNQICEIRDNDLHFTSDEALQFLREETRLDLSDEEAAAITEHTEGWIAGLQLAAISLKGLDKKDKSADFLSAFKGTSRFIEVYLMEEVFNQQPPDIQDFLLQTVILGQMCGSLCDAIRFGRKDETTTKDKWLSSQEIIKYLVQKNLFVVPLDNERKWYRYHHLFTEFLENVLESRISKQEICNLHRCASKWHYKHGILEEAVHHAIAGEDFERAATLIDENIANLYSLSEVPVLLNWIEKLPKVIIKKHPWIEIHNANTLVISGQPEKAERILDDVEPWIQSAPSRETELRGHISAIRAYIANLKGDAEQAVILSEMAEKLLPSNHPSGHAMALFTLADTRLASDDILKSSQALKKMIELGERSNQVIIYIQALCDLVKIQRIQGNLLQAKALLDKAYKHLGDQGYLNSRLRCAYEFEISEVLREWNQLDEAYEHAKIGDEYRNRWGGYLLIGDLVLMRVLLACGETEKAMEALHTAEKIANSYQFQLGLTIEYKTSRVVQYLAVGDLDSATRFVKELDGETQLEQIALARVCIARGQSREALDLLEKLALSTEKLGFTGRLIEVLCLKAIALSMENQTSLAVDDLTHALSLARPEGYLRTFLDFGQPLYKLCKQVITFHKSKTTITAIDQLLLDYTEELIHAFTDEYKHSPDKESQTSTPPLTERELEVLHLLAEGLTNKAIAERLFVAPSTIKQHLKNMYSKLDVHNRTQAVARGQNLDLI